ncbi:hypothetical protein ACQP2P_38510 [Dactylosporangium sp. CA-139114]|uniref:AbiTii domain-containing protein n=1 Tax=Dactylosporangium sp. CA-139114 TaxID=3239931 RepID=UPI003D95E385
MTHRPHDLIRQIQTETLDDTKPLAGILRKCIALGGAMNSVALREWASRELRGYGPDEDLPDCRVIGAVIMIDYVSPRAQVTRHRISPLQLPEVVQEHIKEEVRLRTGVGELEAMVQGSLDKGYINLSLPGGTLTAGLLSEAVRDQFIQVMDAYWSVTTGTIQGCLDQIRTTLTEFTTEMSIAAPGPDGIPPAEAASQALTLAVTGRGHRITVNAPHASEGSSSTVGGEGTEQSHFWTKPRAIGAFVVGLATVIATAIALAQFVGIHSTPGGAGATPSVTRSIR